MSGKRKPVLCTRTVEDDSLTEEDGRVVAISSSSSGSPYDESVSSPESSSSGPTYGARHAGFQLHAHYEVVNEKPSILKKRVTNPVPRETNVKTKKIPEVASTVKTRTSKRDPLPMKLRALPQSFWQQPNQPAMASPGSVYPVLPPLSVSRDNPAVQDAVVRESPEETAHEPLLVSPANTELLFSLFRAVEQEERNGPPVVRRGRPRKAPSSMMTRVLKDDDPCLGSAAGHAALPMLLPQQQHPSMNLISKPAQTLTMVPLREDERTSLSLPALSGIDQNYSQILSELVIRL